MRRTALALLCTLAILAPALAMAANEGVAFHHAPHTDRERNGDHRRKRFWNDGDSEGNPEDQHVEHRQAAPETKSDNRCDDDQR